jgi:hypothetical protein
MIPDSKARAMTTGTVLRVGRGAVGHMANRHDFGILPRVDRLRDKAAIVAGTDVDTERAKSVADQFAIRTLIPLNFRSAALHSAWHPARRWRLQEYGVTKIGSIRRRLSRHL